MTEESTTPDLVALTQQAADAWDTRDLEAALSFYAPRALFDSSLLGIGIFEGRSAIRAHLEDWWSAAYEDYDLKTEEIRDLGNGVVLVVSFHRGRLRGSGGWVQIRIATVLTFADRLIEQHTNYTDIDDARAAAERRAEERG